MGLIPYRELLDNQHGDQMKIEKVETEKKEYIAPELTVHGDVEVITLGFTTGGHLDASFPTGFPTPGLTFS